MGIRFSFRFQKTNASFANPQSTILNPQFRHSFLIRFYRITNTLGSSLQYLLLSTLCSLLSALSSLFLF